MELIKDLPDRLLFAIPKKGRLHSACLSLLEGADIQFHRKNRLDIALVKNLPIALVFLPAGDIAKFVGEGNVDLGITGQDMVAEAEAQDKVTEILELGFGKCRLCVQVPVKNGAASVDDLVGKRIATSFEGISKNFFDEVDAKVAAANGTAGTDAQKKTELVFVSGSVEAACALGLADGIVDLVESGETMQAAGLHDIVTILSSQAVLIASKKPSHPDLVQTIAGRIKGVIAAQKYVYINYNVERKHLKEATLITPGRQAPTVSPLENPEWVAVSSMVLKHNVAQTMDDLEAIGARDILLFAIQNCRV
ncbi:ATP phosphoribosyltransferase (ATP-PRTase) (ATP-PRT) [Mortierella hygrophila]|uniref:ATP phosphoribosyltransferase n=1 Tax=Mortierella hygrophila TaxID=979708 RepID=A0A9P6K0N7_9FUNG|nr:ATP phosphoribosyltransferase (ATP-PRTase) (ATP-PRT) [Mortierella hygrophila]